MIEDKILTPFTSEEEPEEGTKEEEGTEEEVEAE